MIGDSLLLFNFRRQVGPPGDPGPKGEKVGIGRVLLEYFLQPKGVQLHHIRYGNKVYSLNAICERRPC